MIAVLALVTLALAWLAINDGFPSGPGLPAALSLELTQLGPFSPVTTVALTLDSLLVDSYGGAEWEVRAVKSDGTNFLRRVQASHNGTASADATVATSAGSGAGASSELTDLSVDLSGATTAQVMRLRITMTFGAGTWKVSVWRLPMKPPQYA